MPLEGLSFNHGVVCNEHISLMCTCMSDEARLIVEEHMRLTHENMSGGA